MQRGVGRGPGFFFSGGCNRVKRATSAPSPSFSLSFSPSSISLSPSQRFLAASHALYPTHTPSQSCGISFSPLSSLRFPSPGLISVPSLLCSQLNPFVLTAFQAIYDPSMFGFNVTQQDFPYDNRPMAPLQQYTFEQWWFVSAYRRLRRIRHRRQSLLCSARTLELPP